MNWPFNHCGTFSILVSAVHAVYPVFAGKEMYVAAVVWIVERYK